MPNQSQGLWSESHLGRSHVWLVFPYSTAKLWMKLCMEKHWYMPQSSTICDLIRSVHQEILTYCYIICKWIEVIHIETWFSSTRNWDGKKSRRNVPRAWRSKADALPRQRSMTLSGLVFLSVCCALYVFVFLNVILDLILCSFDRSNGSH